MKSLTPKELRRVRIFQYVLFGVFTLFYCAVLKGDALATLVFRLSGEKWLLSPWIIACVLTSILLLCLVSVLRFRLLLPARISLAKRLFLMATAFFAIGVLTDSNETHTLELRMARYCAMGKYEEALKEGERFVHPSAHLFALRSHALSQLQTGSRIPIAEHLFDYPLPARTSSKMLQLDSTATSIAPFYGRIKQLQSEQPAEVLEEQALNQRLMGALLDGHLNIFVHHLPKRYLLEKVERIPTTYREALYLYSRLTSRPIQTYRDANTAANYRDFIDYRQKVRRQYPAHVKGAKDAERNMMRTMYGGTYWFYYFYERNNID